MDMETWNRDICAEELNNKICVEDEKLWLEIEKIITEGMLKMIPLNMILDDKESIDGMYCALNAYKKYFKDMIDRLFDEYYRDEEDPYHIGLMDEIRKSGLI